ncbi:MAG: hypothetical protein IIV90_04020 [Oscillospiraceae bacterium]|nr:hypothetical protein [Oscillospiraceae bacterium]
MIFSCGKIFLSKKEKLSQVNKGQDFHFGQNEKLFERNPTQKRARPPPPGGRAERAQSRKAGGGRAQGGATTGK